MESTGEKLFIRPVRTLHCPWGNILIDALDGERKRLFRLP